jgi:hypothetical protein
MNLFTPDNATPNDAPGHGPEALAQSRFVDVWSAVDKLTAAADMTLDKASSHSDVAEAIVAAAYNAPDSKPAKEVQPLEAAQSVATIDPQSSQARQEQARAALAAVQEGAQEFYGLQEAA